MQVYFFAFILERHSNSLTVYCAYSNSTHSEERPEYPNLAWYLQFLSDGLVQLPDCSKVFVSLRETWLSRSAYFPGMERSDSGPRTDKVRTLRDGFPRCGGVAEAKNDTENYWYSCALAYMHCWVNRNWTK